MMRPYAILAALAAAAAFAPAAQAHYGMIIPSDPMIAQEDGRSVGLTFSFSHPFAADGMVLDLPATVTVTTSGETSDITDLLVPGEVMGTPGYTMDYPLGRPGTYVFAMEPQPYWEPSEDSFILHYTKTYVTAYGDDEGWDAELGLKTEIVPLSKPFALWAGNAFQGVVMFDGAPVPFAEVEAAFYNADRSAVAPDALMEVQTLKADANGVFTYATPAPGWWGFAALSEADYTLPQDGAQKTVELGAVIWVHFEEWQSR